MKDRQRRVKRQEMRVVSAKGEKERCIERTVENECAPRKRSVSGKRVGEVSYRAISGGDISMEERLMIVRN